MQATCHAARCLGVQHGFDSLPPISPPFTRDPEGRPCRRRRPTPPSRHCRTRRTVLPAALRRTAGMCRPAPARSTRG